MGGQNVLNIGPTPCVCNTDQFRNHDASHLFQIAICKRLVGFTRIRHRIVEETFIGLTESSIDRDRAAHGVNPFFERSKDQGITTVDEVIVEGLDHDGLPFIPVGSGEDQLLNRFATRRHNFDVPVSIRRNRQAKAILV